jgi:hypothetical protein
LIHASPDVSLMAERNLVFNHEFQSVSVPVSMQANRVAAQVAWRPGMHGTADIALTLGKGGFDDWRTAMKWADITWD